MSDEHRSGGDEALRYCLAKRDRREQTVFPIPKKPTGNRSTKGLFDMRQSRHLQGPSWAA
jgi:hypothetical protein